MGCALRHHPTAAVLLFLYFKKLLRRGFSLQLVLVRLILKWKLSETYFFVSTIRILMSIFKVNCTFFSWYCIKCKILPPYPAIFRQILLINCKLLIQLLSHFNLVSTYYWLRKYFNIPCTLVLFQRVDGKHCCHIVKAFLMGRL